jgi:hypothetical protein
VCDVPVIPPVIRNYFLVFEERVASIGGKVKQGDSVGIVYVGASEFCRNEGKCGFGG